MDLEYFNQNRYETSSNIDYALELTPQMMEKQVILTQMFVEKEVRFAQQEEITSYHTEDDSFSDSTGKIKSNTYNALANLAPMIQQIIEQQAIINQMFAKRLSQQE